MKKLKKMIVLAVLAVVMTMMVSVSAKAEEIVWGKGYEVRIETNGTTRGTNYSFTLPSSGAVTIVADDSGYVRYCIYDKSGAAVWSVNYSKGGLSTYKVELLAGEYTLKMDHWVSFNVSFTANFTPSGETISEGYMNKNNQVGTASSYTVGSKVKAQFAKNDDKDIYKVKIAKAGYLKMNYSSDITKFNMEMVSASGDVSYKENGIPLGASSYKYFVPKGTYYISFERDGNGYTGTYTFSTKLSDMTKSQVRAAKNVKGQKAKITWAKKSDVDGYQVQVAQNKKFTKGRKSTTIAVYSYSHQNSYTFTKLKKGKTYYARVRTYKLANGKKVYSDWSAAKAVKIRK